MKDGLVVLSLFDGMSCGQIALQKLGIKVKKYYAAEIDKHAIKVTQHNFPDTIQLGDVTQIKGCDLDKIDLLIGGSPCQGFSFAGKQLAFDDPRSKLFFEFVRLKNECNPRYFFLENVKMKKEYEVIISQYMGINPIEINSALVCAQNRVRLYWTNIGAEPQGLFGHLECMIPQPRDKGILLKHILEDEVDEKYYLSDKMLNYFQSRAANFNQGKVNIREEEGKASCLTSSMSSVDISDNFIKLDTNLQKSPNQEKSNCFTAGGNSGGLHSDMTLIVDMSGGTNSIYQRGRGFNKGGEHIEKSPPITSNAWDQNNTLAIRRLTPIECERLQTVPDNYTACVSDTQRYRMLGNGWTVDVVAYIFGFMDLPAYVNWHTQVNLLNSDYQSLSDLSEKPLVTEISVSKKNI